MCVVSNDGRFAMITVNIIKHVLGQKDLKRIKKINNLRQFFIREKYILYNGKYYLGGNYYGKIYLEGMRKTRQERQL